MTGTMAGRVAPARGGDGFTDCAALASVDIAASLQRTFKALTDPAELIKWWRAPDGCRVARWKVDLRVGGRWEVRGEGNDGRPFLVEGEFLVIEAPTRLVLEWHSSWEPGVETIVSYRLEPVPTGTRVTLRHERYSIPRAPGVLR